MRKVSVHYLKPEMILGRDIVDADGCVLMASGLQLTEPLIQRLVQLGIRSVYIKDLIFGATEESQTAISEETRINTVKTVKENFKNLSQERQINTQSVQQVIDRMLDEILGNIDVLINLNTISTTDDYLFNHSVNVCTMAILTGISFGYSDQKLKELGTGALLHDVGKSLVDPPILKNDNPLTPEEYAELQKHTEYGFAILRKASEIPLLAAHVAYQHHERWDGQGYPRKLRSSEIHEYARIVAVANMYDEMLLDRPNRPPYNTNQAINLLKKMSGVHFDPRCVDAMISHIAMYPSGTVVKLNTGEIGIVTQVNDDLPARPKVRITFDRFGKKLANPHEIDLANMTTINVSQVLTEKELAQNLNRFS